MIRLWLTSSHPAQAEELQQAYQDCLTAIEYSRPKEDIASRHAYFTRILRQLAADRERLSPEFRAEVLGGFKESILEESFLNGHPLIRHWAVQAFNDLGFDFFSGSEPDV